MRFLTLLFSLLAINAFGSNVIISYTNSSTGSLDTNDFRTIPLSNIANSDGTYNTIGIPVRYHNTAGVRTNFYVQNNYLLTNSATGFWLQFRVPDSSTNEVTLGSIAGPQNANPFWTLIVNTNIAGSGGSATNVDYTVGGVLENLTTNAGFSSTGTNAIKVVSSGVIVNSNLASLIPGGVGQWTVKSPDGNIIQTDKGKRWLDTFTPITGTYLSPTDGFLHAGNAGGFDGGNLTNIASIVGGVLADYTTNASFSASGTNVITALAAQQALAATNALGSAAYSAATDFAAASVTTNLVGAAFYLSSFGAKADGIELHDATITSGSAVISSPTASFVNSDVGKTLWTYYDNTNLTYLLTTIASVQSPTSATMADISTVSVSGTNTFGYGSDNTTAFQDAYNAAWLAGGGVISGQSGIYVLSGVCSNRNATALGESSVVSLRSTFIRQSPTNRNITIVLTGPVPGAHGVSVDTNYPPTSGMIIFCPTKPTLANSATNFNCIFGANCAVNNYSLEQYWWKNLTIRKVRGTPLHGIAAPWGGGIGLADVGMDVDYNLGDQIRPPNYVSLYVPTNSVQNAYTDTAIWLPGTDNDSNVKLVRLYVYGWGCGVEAGEHSSISDSEFEYNGTGISLFTSLPAYGANYNTAGAYGDKIHLLGNAVQIAAFTNASSVNFDYYGVVFENKTNTSTELYDKTGGILRGFISYFSTRSFPVNARNYTSTNLNWFYTGNYAAFPAWNITGATISGNGSSLTNLNGTNIISGTISSNAMDSAAYAAFTASGSGISAATATNIAAYQTQIATNGAGLNQPQPIPGLTYWLTLNEGSGTTARDLMSTNFATASSTNYWTKGLIRSGFKFVRADTNYINLGAPNAFAIRTNAFTMNIWFNIPTNLLADDTVLSFGGSNDTNGGALFVDGNTPGQILVVYFCHQYVISNTIAASRDTWHMLTFTGNGGANRTNSIYMDGILLGSAAYQYSFTAGTTWYMGQNQSSSIQNLQGTLDDFQIYNRVLTGSEMADLYNGGFGSSQGGSSQGGTAGGGGFVSTATTNLNMAGYDITNVNNLSVNRSLTASNAVLYGVTLLGVTGLGTMAEADTNDYVSTNSFRSWTNTLGSAAFTASSAYDAAGAALAATNGLGSLARSNSIDATLVDNAPWLTSASSLNGTNIISGTINSNAMDTATLAAFTASASGISAATATNIAAYQAQIATNGLTGGGSSISVIPAFNNSFNATVGYSSNLTVYALNGSANGVTGGTGLAYSYMSPGTYTNFTVWVAGPADFISSTNTFVLYTNGQPTGLTLSVGGFSYKSQWLNGTVNSGTFSIVIPTNCFGGFMVTNSTGANKTGVAFGFSGNVIP